VSKPVWLVLSLLWLAGACLRMTILAVPPVILLIAADLHLSGTEIGVLSGLPSILLACAALPGALLISRFGARWTLIAGLLVTAVASALRGAVLSTIVLYAATVAMSAGIAIMQPALPPLVGQWLPQRVSFATAVFTNGLLVGETLAVIVTGPLVLPLVHGSWRGALAAWSLPVLVVAGLMALLAPRASRPDRDPTASSAIASWWPNWRNKEIWRIGFMLGSVNSVYFASNAFLPGHLTELGRADLVAGALAAVNLGQLPASVVLLAISSRIEQRALPFILSGVLMLLCLAGIVMTASAWTIAFAGGLGALCAVVLTLGFALPPLLTTPSEVARLSAAMFTISYTEGLIVSVLSGAAWDLSGTARFAFLPMAISVLPLLFTPAALRFHRPPKSMP
jgi:CP family cyanate transporter-like MFS transporter